MSNAASLKNRTALVTGAARRLGKSIALELARRGANVAVHYHTSHSAALATVAEIRALGVEGEAVRADLSDPAQIEQLGDEVSARIGSVQILINNASLFEPSRLAETTIAQLRQNDSIHVHTPLVLSRWLARQLPDDDTGAIVNLLDHRASRPDPKYVPYSLSKAGLSALTELLARELAPRIRVNSVSPGAILAPTRIVAEERTNHLQRASAGALLERAGRVEDVVAATLFLIAEAEYTTGVDLPVDGGKHLGC